ncbi:MAG: ribbon-helix-helix domain-containing protein [Hyphomicrobiaceae bacterium]
MSRRRQVASLTPGRAIRAARSISATANPARPVKHSFSVAGHRTSISLESAFWDALRDAAAVNGVSIAELVRRIDSARGEAGLSSAVRVWILTYARSGALADPAAVESLSRRTEAQKPEAGADADEPGAALARGRS